MSYGNPLATSGYSSICLTGARFTMSATLLHREYYDGTPIDEGRYGEWIKSQDPLTGQIVREWQPNLDNPQTPEDENTMNIGVIPCMARGIVDGGIRVAGTTERFGELYENIDYVRLWVPASVTITKSDRVTNIKDSTGHTRWLDEEYPDSGPKATVFNVNGVTPLFNAFNKMTEQYVLLERAEVS